MNKKYRELLKNIFLFTISNFIPKAINFFLVPFYTSYLTTSEYGIADLINSMVSLIFPILTLDMRDAVLKFTLDKKYNKEDSLNISLKIIICDIIFLSIFTILQLTFNFIKINNIYIIFFDFLTIVNSFYDIFNAYCKGTDNVKTIVIVSCLTSTINLSLNILFISVLKLGLYGFLLSNLIALIVADITFVLNAKLYKDFSLNYNKKQKNEMIKYSFPVVFSTIAWWINNASDRYIISFIIGVSASGIYAVASKIPTILTTFQNVFMQAWSISAIKEFDKDDSDGFIGNIYTNLSCLLCIICSLIMIFNKLLAKILFKGDFFIAWKYVPFLSLAVTVDGLALLIGNLFFAVKDTKARSLTTIIGATSNTILNFIFIPKIGAYGATIATFIGYFLGFIFSRIMIKKYININTNYKINDFCLFLIFVQAILAYFGNRFIFLQIIILFIIIIFYKNSISKMLGSIIMKFKMCRKKSS